MLLLGFASGLPLMLVLSTLPQWLTYSHRSLAAIGLTANLGLPYILKFLWAPVFDEIRPPLPLGRRRGWLVAVQAGLLAAIVWLALSQPQTALLACLAAAFAVSFLSASQDIMIDAWRIETFAPELQGAALAAYVWGYRAAMLLVGAGALALSQRTGFNTAVLLMAACFLAGPIATLIAPEPDVGTVLHARGFARRLREGVVEPITEFLHRRGAWVIVGFIVLFRLGEAMASTMLPPYYRFLGFDRATVALANGPVSLVASLAGVALGGVLVARIGLARALLATGIFQTVSLVMYPLLGLFPGQPHMLMTSAILESFAQAFSDAAFLAYLSYLCSPAHTATQYALLSSLAAVGLRTLGGATGLLAAKLGFIAYFSATTIAALPAMVVMLVILRRYPPQQPAVRR